MTAGNCYSQLIREKITADFRGMYREPGEKIPQPFLTPGSQQYAAVLWDSWLADVTYVNDWQQDFEGSWILKFAGKYILFQSDWWGEDKLQRHAAKTCPFGYGRYGTYDWMYTVSDHIRGPYGPPRLAVPHGGTCSVIQAPDGRWMASVFGGDSTAPFACSLAFIPLDICEQDGEIQVSVRP